MITRIEIDGFKSFADFSLDVPPFLLLVGANASGKSNLVDALRLVAEAQPGDSSRTVLDFPRGSAEQLFRRHGGGDMARRLDIRVRALGSAEVRRHAGDRVFTVDGEWEGHLAAELGTQGLTADFDVFSPDEEPDDTGWFFTALPLLFLDVDPVKAAGRASASDQRALSADAGNLASVLGRFQEQGILPELILDASTLIPALDDIRVVRDHRGDWDYDLVFREAGPLPPILASHGTLRVLALLAALHDPTRAVRTVVVDEIETGLHPSRLKALVSIIRRRIDAARDPDGGHPLQVIATTHSPVVLAQALHGKDGADVMFVDTAFKREEIDGEAVMSPVTRVRGVGEDGPRGSQVTPVEVRQFLDTVRQDDW